VLEKLAPNDYKVDAYYLRDEKGEITEAFIFQNDVLVDELQNIGTFNTAASEQTESDEAVFVAQRKKISEFNSYVGARAINRVGVIKKTPKRADDEAEELIAKIEPIEEPVEEMQMYDYASRALASL
jgi:hypothetical protein